MKKDECLLDTDILIDNLRGYQQSKDFLKQFELGEKEGYISIITVAELSAGNIRDKYEEIRIKGLISIFNILEIDFRIAWFAGEIKKIYNMRLPDSLIAAAASIYGLKLITRNTKHFTKIKEISVVKPY